MRNREQGSITVDSLIGIFVATVTAMFFSLVPGLDPYSFDNGQTALSMVQEARRAAHATGVAELTLASSGAGTIARLYEANHSGSTDSVTGVAIGLVRSEQLDEPFTLADGSTPIALPITIRFSKDGQATINGSSCTILSFAFSERTVTDSFSLSCSG